jgi:hypothetical protein
MDHGRPRAADQGMKIYIVNAGRPWEQWLADPELQSRGVLLSEELKRPDEIKKASFYAGAGVFLALVHGVDEAAASDFVSAWHALGEAKSRVWWLFYNGTGYRAADCRDTQVHFLRFDIGYEQLWRDERRRLIDFILSIHTPGAQRPTEAFNRLYPADNVALASFLALLCAGRYVSIESDSAALRRNDELLRHVYSQYMLIRAAGDTQSEDLESWKTELREGHYDQLASRISAVLGQVPD